MSRYGRLVDLERHARAVTGPLLADPARLLAAEGEVDGAHVGDAERARVVHGAHRRRVDAGDEDAGDQPLRRGGRPAAHRRHVRDDDARLGEQAELQRELVRQLRLLDERRPLELLGDDDGDEVRLAARQAPDLLEHRLGDAERRVESLERQAGALEPARADAGIGAAGRHVHGANRRRSRSGARSAGPRRSRRRAPRRAAASSCAPAGPRRRRRRPAFSRRARPT